MTIFILPPSRGALEKRLRDRRTESDAAIARRLADAVGDMSHWNEFDYVVVNDDFPRALEDLTRIVDSKGEALRANRPALIPLLAELLA
jgi:guanylate kinase